MGVFADVDSLRQTLTLRIETKTARKFPLNLRLSNTLMFSCFIYKYLIVSNEQRMCSKHTQIQTSTREGLFVLSC